MKFKLNLDESLFDDELDSFLTKDTISQDSGYDDDFSDYEDSHSVENVLPGPAEGSDTGVASVVINLINDEWEAIQGYNDAIATLRAEASNNPFYEDAIKVLEEISAEENVHVGQLQEILKHVSPNAAEIQKGTKEAKSQLGLVNGLLPVQSWEDTKTTQTANNMFEEEMCTLSDIDDEM
jgi:hypothetical protein